MTRNLRLLSFSLVVSLPAAFPGEAAPAQSAKRITQYVLDVWQIDDGLPSNHVLDILRTRDGYLWLATRGGLVRFDGVRFRIFDDENTPAFETDDFGCLAEGPDGSLWAGSRGAGLYRYRAGRWSVHRAASAAGNDVRALLVGRGGDLWVGTLAGLHQLRQGALSAVDVLEPLAGTHVRALHEDGSGDLWIGTQNEGLFRFRGGEVQRLEPEPGLTSRRVNAVHSDRQGSVWIGTGAGLYRVAGDRIAVYTEREGLAAADVRDLFGERDGGLWVATNRGLNRLSGGRLETFGEADGLTDGRLRSLFEDPQGNLWAGSYGGGLSRFKDGPITAFTTREGLRRGGFRLGTRAIRQRNLRLLADIERRRAAQAEREEFVRELEAKNAELERFTYMVSHDLTSPLVTIKGFLGLVRKDAAAAGKDPGAAERLEHDLERIGAAADNMRRLLEELLELSRVGRLVNPSQQVSLSELAREAAELVAGPLAMRGVEVEIARDLPPVFVDRARLVEVFQNLLENAASFMGEQAAPRVEVGERPAGAGEVCCYVRDNGVGIERKYHEKIFGLFERLDAASEGTGIGLALVKRIVELHGGRIWIESEGLGHGSTFCFTLPLGGPVTGAV